MSGPLKDLPYRKHIPPKWAPLFIVALSFLFLFQTLSLAIFFSHTFALDSDTYVRMHAKDADASHLSRGDMFVIWTWFSDPWYGLLWGVLVGTVAMLGVRNLKRRNIEHAAELSLRGKRSIRAIGDRHALIGLTIVLVSILINLAGAYYLDISPKTSVTAQLIPIFLLYGTERRINDQARAKYTAALELGMIPDGSLRPSRSQRVSVWLIPLLIAAVCIGFAVAIGMMWRDMGEFYDRQLEMVGSTRTSEEAQALEERLERNPGDRDAHVILAWYYAGARFEVPEDEQDAMREGYYRHTLWLVEHAPENFASILLFPRDGEAYEEARRLWLQNIETGSDDPKTLMNAAKFFDGTDPTLAEGLLQKGQALEPDNPEWREELSRLRVRQQRRTEREQMGQEDPGETASGADDE